MSKNFRRAPLRSRRVLATAIAATIFVPRAFAITDNYTGADAGSWNTAANWTTTSATHVVPANGDDATLGSTSTVNSVNFNTIYSGAGLNSLTLDSPGHAQILLNQTIAGTAMFATTELIGTTVIANYYNQTTGTNSASTLALGIGSSSSGNYTLGGGTLTATSTTVGSAGVGTFVQTGGTFNVNSFVQIGLLNAVTPSTYNLSGGTMSFASGANLNVGISGKASFTQSGGTVTFAGSSSNLNLAYNAFFNNNTYTLSNTGQINGGNIIVGRLGSATFTQTGGTVNTSVVDLGDFGGSSIGTYNLSASTGTGSLTTSETNIGDAGTGTFVQTGGAHSYGVNGLYLGFQNGSNGTYSLSAGTLTAGSSIYTGIVGVSGTGTFVQTGGINTAGNLSLATGATGVGRYSLSAGTLAVTGDLDLANAGNATFTQLGGTNTVTGHTTLGGQFNTSVTGGTATYNLISGNFNANDEYVGYNASTNALFAQSGGTHTAQTIIAGFSAGSVGTYTISAGTLNVDQIDLSYQFGSSGSFRNGGGAVNLGSTATPGIMYIGEFGSSATYTQTAGTLNAIGSGSIVAFGVYPGVSGSGTLRGGSISAEHLAVGYYGSGSFAQQGGTINATSSIYGLELGVISGSDGFFTMDNSFGASAINAGKEVIGAGGSGTFFQYAGINTVTATMTLGNNSGSAGVYDLLGGTLSTNTLQVGNSGTGVFYHDGGVVNAQSILIRVNAGSSGTYNLAGGSIASPTTPNSFIVYPGGTFNETGGDQAAYLTNQGNLNFTAGAFTGTLENAVNGNVSIAAGSSLIAGAVLNKGTIALASNISLGATSPGTLDNENILALTGGSTTGSGNIINNGQLSGYGTIGGSGGITNNLSFIQGAGNITLSNSGTNINNGTITLATGRQLQLAAALNNNSSLQLNGALVNGNSALINAAGGVITGPGTITAPFSNSGTLAPNGTSINITPAWTNAGIIQLSNATSSVIGGAITNTGNIQGAGSIGSNISNTLGTIEPQNGSLNLTGALTNSSGGTLRASFGSKLLVTNFPINNGRITLGDGTFQSTGALTNSATGNITGHGIFMASSIANAGKMNFSAGLTDIYGPVTNASGSSIIVTGGGTTTFSDPMAHNSGANIQVSTNSTAVFEGAVTGSGTFSGPGLKIFDAGGGPPSVLTSVNTVVGSTNVETSSTLNVSVLYEKSLLSRGDVNITPKSQGGTTARVAGLTVPNGGLVNLNDNNLIVDYTGATPAASIRQLLISGYGSGNWSGTTGVTSAIAHADASLHHTLGYGDAAALGITNFGGQTITGNAIVVKYTYPGDSNLDGKVDLDNDFSLFVAGYNTQISNPGALNATNLWVSGDYNYDGKVDLDNDFSIFVDSYAAYTQNPTQLAQLDAIINSMDLTTAQKNQLLSVVPEPATLTFAISAVSCLLFRRRRMHISTADAFE